MMAKWISSNRRTENKVAQRAPSRWVRGRDGSRTVALGNESTAALKRGEDAADISSSLFHAADRSARQSMQVRGTRSWYMCVVISISDMVYAFWVLHASIPTKLRAILSTVTTSVKARTIIVVDSRI